MAKALSRWLFRPFVLCVLIEPFGDSMMRPFMSAAAMYDQYMKITITLTLAVILVAGVRFLPRWSALWTPFWLVVLVYTYGLAVGLVANMPKNALNDFISVTPILLALVIARYSILDPASELLWISRWIVGIVLVKYLLYQAAAVVVFGTPSWKILLKQSPLLLIPYSILLSDFLKRPILKTGAIVLLVLYLMFTAQTRMLVIAAGVVTVVHVGRGAKVRGILVLAILIAVSLFGYAGLQQVAIRDSLLQLYGGEVYQGGMEYRMVQFGELVHRFTERPIMGVGLGYFSPTYLTYFELAKPYQLELDLLNFVTKVGLVGASFYFLSYPLLLAQVRTVANVDTRHRLTEFYVALIGCLIYSLGQTLHQGYTFWVFYAIFCGFLVLAIKQAHEFASPQARQITGGNV